MGTDGPGPRSRHCLVWESEADAIVLFGGIIWSDSPTVCSDTWELRNGEWFLIEKNHTPSPRHRATMIYDGQHGYSVLFGGQSNLGEFLGDTWIYAERSWKRWKVGWWGGRPGPRCGHGMAFDETERIGVLFGGIDHNDNPLGDTWLFENTQWRPVGGPAPSARRYAAFTYDPELEGCVLHGGSEDDHGHKRFGDAWLFKGRTWLKMSENFTTEARDDHQLAYHSSAKRLLMLEGIGGARGLLARERTGWRELELTPQHQRHQCSPLVWSKSLTGLVLHGGETGHGGPQFDTTLVLRAGRGVINSYPRT